MSSPYSVEGAQAKLKQTLSGIDTELSKYKYANDFERMTGVPKSYAVLGVAGVTFLMIFFNIAGQLLTNSISWLYPGKV
jgi:receptor expression-enhancing protein 5/6